MAVKFVKIKKVGQKHVSKMGKKKKVAVGKEKHFFFEGETRNRVEDGFGCPPNTVLSGAFSSDADYMGQ